VPQYNRGGELDSPTGETSSAQTLDIAVSRAAAKTNSSVADDARLQTMLYVLLLFFHTNVQRSQRHDHGMNMFQVIPMMVLFLRVLIRILQFREKPCLWSRLHRAQN
jgi:hypothetical protein